MKKILPKILWCALIGLGLAPAMRAVEVGSGYQTTAPTSSDSPAYEGWDYVGSVNSASGVYIGDYDGTYWVLTAAHVGAGTFTLGGYTYTVVSGVSYSDFTATINDTVETADLTLYEITSTDSNALAALSGLTNLTLAGQSGGSEPSTGSTVLMIGNGGGKSWGTNTVTTVGAFSGEYGSDESVGIVTLASGEGGNGAQGVSGDSGGGMFQIQHGKLVLTGILAAITDDYDTSGNGTDDQGGATFAVDLAYYSSQIISDIDANVSAIPEPASVALGIGSMALGMALWRRRRSS